MGGDPGTIANMIDKQYSNIKKGRSLDSDNSSTDVGDKPYLNANEARQQFSSLDFYCKNGLGIELMARLKAMLHGSLILRRKL